MLIANSAKAEKAKPRTLDHVSATSVFSPSVQERRAADEAQDSQPQVRSGFELEIGIAQRTSEIRSSPAPIRYEINESCVPPAEGLSIRKSFIYNEYGIFGMDNGDAPPFGWRFDFALDRCISTMREMRT